MLPMHVLVNHYSIFPMHAVQVLLLLCSLPMCPPNHLFCCRIGCQKCVVYGTVRSLAHVIFLHVGSAACAARASLLLSVL